MLYILTPLFCALLCIGAVFSYFVNAKSNAVYAATTPITETVYWGYNVDTRAAYLSSTEIVNETTRSGSFQSDQDLTGAPWGYEAHSITFETVIAPKKTRYWFASNYYVEEIHNLNLLDMSNVVDASFMFYDCMGIKELDVSNFDVRNLVNARRMFGGCSSVTSLDLSMFYTPKLEDAYCMFYNCINLKFLDISNLDFTHCTEALYFIENQGADFRIKISDSVATSELKPLSMLLTLYDEDGESYNVSTETLPRGGTYYKTRQHVHKWQLISTLAEPTCETDGSGYYECQESDCPTKSKTDAIPATGHSYTTYENDNNATCTQDGTETAQCNNGCGKPDIRVKAGSKLGHDFANAPLIDTDPTNHWHVCQRQNCDETDTPQAHTFVWVIDNPATVNSAGEKHEECTVCHFTRNQGTVIPSLVCGHKNKTRHPALAATCTQTGNVEYWTCNDCQINLNANDVEIIDVVTKIDPDNHDIVHHGAQAPACVETGWGEYDTCTRCGYTTYSEIPALGHDYQWIITLMPTEDKEGLKEEICSRCEDKRSEEVIAKLVNDEGGNGGVADLPTDNDYELEIAVKESDVTYNIAGISKGYVVELYVVDGGNKTPYDDQKTVTLMLIIPEGMEDNFKLYKRSGDILEPVAAETYTVNGRMLTIKTKLPSEFVFNAPAPTSAAEKAGIPWWVWVIIVLSVVVVIILIIVIVTAVKKKNGGNGGVTVTSDNGEVIGRLDKQDEKIDRLIEITDGGFNDVIDGE